MNMTDSEKQLQDLVLRYLYDDLDSRERADFEQEVAGNQLLQALLEREQVLDRAIPRGTAAYIDDQRLEDNRSQVRRQLQKQLRRQLAGRSAAGEFLAMLLQRPSLAVLQGAALALTFVLGYGLAGSGGSSNGPSVAGGVLSPLALVGEQDYEISSLHIERFDPVSGDIELSFAIASDTHLNGNVSEVGIRTLMTVALLNEIEEAARLDTIEALQNASFDQRVSESMIHVLGNDENPGVRYSAVRSLVNYVEDERVQSALRAALQQDVNPGVRVEAFNALARNPDADTLGVFRQIAEVDGNEYIRERARAIVDNASDGLGNSEIF